MTLRRGVPLLLAVVARVLAAQSSPAALTGTVTDSETGRPLEGAVVLLAGTQLRAVTTEAGQYRLAGIPPGRYSARVTLFGYRSAERSDLALDSGAVHSIDFRPAKALIDLPPMVVTASRAEELPEDVPASVAVLTHDALLRYQAITVDQALPFVPGVIFNNG